MRLLLIAAVAALAFPALAETPPVTHDTTPATDDPYIWLEDIHGQRSMDWVEKENARSLAVLQADPRYQANLAAALTIVNATDRIPDPGQIGSTIYNLWQDPTNVRGLWRRTSPESFATAAPAWETVLDLDALSKAEKANWVWHGANCPPPAYTRCLVSLSDGGEDADTVREFDLTTKSFVDGGFALPRSKQTADWLDADTLIVARDWGPGTMTTSSYPFVVKTLKRGQSLDQAVEVFRGKPDDVGVSPVVLHDGDGHKLVLIVRNVDFFHQQTYQVTADSVVPLRLPEKITIDGLIGGRLVFQTLQDWEGFKAGDLLACDPQACGGKVLHASAAPASSPRYGATPDGQTSLLFSPGPRQSIEQVAVTKDRVVAAIYGNVRGGISVFHPDKDGWVRTPFGAEPNVSVNLASSTLDSDLFFYDVDGFLTPTHLVEASASADGLVGGLPQAVVKSLPARFDASGDTVDQYEATSSDGTKVPYFVVHPKGMKLDGANPTILYAYGGFQVSMLPSYSATIGKLWLEHGGVYVLANIRGGGEFGPAWHEAGLKTHRQLVYDDFAAVAKDLIARNITSPRRLGIQGGSNGGLLMGVEFIQHPDLWRAVDIQVPLLDMLRIGQIGAGASWAGEYGDVSDPAIRAFWEKTSPYQNLKAGVAYPEPFFVTATSDDRVTPVHARKMAAKMEAMGLPFLYFENTNGGHAASANLQERAERVALEFTYFARKLMD